MLTERAYNPYAPPALNGVNAPTGQSFFDVDGVYVLNTPAFLANQEILGNEVGINTDSDFLMRGIVAPALASSGALFRFYTSSGYYLSDGYINASAYTYPGTAAPYAIWPEMLFPAGTRILTDIINNNGFGMNPFQILFKGVRRFNARGVK